MLGLGGVWKVGVRDAAMKDVGRMRSVGPLPTAIMLTLAGLRLLALISRKPFLPNYVLSRPGFENWMVVDAV